MQPDYNLMILSEMKFSYHGMIRSIVCIHAGNCHKKQMQDGQEQELLISEDLQHLADSSLMNEMVGHCTALFCLPEPCQYNINIAYQGMLGLFVH